MQSRENLTDRSPRVDSNKIFVDEFKLISGEEFQVNE